MGSCLQNEMVCSCHSSTGKVVVERFYGKRIKGLIEWARAHGGPCFAAEDSNYFIKKKQHVHSGPHEIKTRDTA